MKKLLIIILALFLFIGAKSQIQQPLIKATQALIANNYFIYRGDTIWFTPPVFSVDTTDVPESFKVADSTYTVLNDVMYKWDGSEWVASFSGGGGGADGLNWNSSTGNLDLLDGGVVIDSENLDGRYQSLGGGVDSMVFSPITTDTHEQGKIWYDSEKDAFSYMTSVDGVQINLGFETVLWVYNNTGSTITNGSIVAPEGVQYSGFPGAILADNRYKNRSSIVAIATHDILNGTVGLVTHFGEVGGLNTTAYAGYKYLYLGHNGTISTNRASDGEYEVIVGSPGNIGTTDGTIIADINESVTTVEINQQGGFPSHPVDIKDSCSLSFSNSTRTFTISPVDEHFHYYIEGEKYLMTSPVSVVISDTEGYHIIYFDPTGLKSIANATYEESQTIIRSYCIVAELYWNATDNKIEYGILEERHGIDMTGVEHLYHHNTIGSQYLDGIALGDILADATGSLDAHAQYSVTTGSFADEDLVHVVPTTPVGTTIPVAYLYGANGDIRVDSTSGFALLTAGTGRLAYNQWTGTTWQLTEVDNANYVLYHLFSMNGYAENRRLITVPGTSQYGSVIDARIAATTEITSIIGTFGATEGIPVATLIYETRDAYTNSVNARIRTTDTGDNYINWLTSELAQGVAPTSHAFLTNVEQAGLGVYDGHISNTTQSLYGIKTFMSSPLVPTPTLDTQASNKVYTDTKADTIYTEKIDQFSIDKLKYDNVYGSHDVTEIMKPDGIIEGGIVVWQSDLIFNTSDCAYYIEGNFYTTSEQLDTLSTADATNPRLDVLAVDTTGEVIVITGTPAASPQKPTVDPVSQIELTSILVNALATEPDAVADSVIYDENIEWTGTSSGVAVDFESTNNVYNGTYATELGSVTTGDYVKYVAPSAINIDGVLSLHYAKKVYNDLYYIPVRLYLSGSPVSSYFIIPTMSVSDTDYHVFSINLSSIESTSTTFDEIRFEVSVYSGTPTGFFLDYIKVETGIEQPAMTVNPDLQTVTEVGHKTTTPIEAASLSSKTQSLTETSGAVTWDMSMGAHVEVTIDEETVTTITNMPNGVVSNIVVTQGDSGDDNMLFSISGCTVKWRGNDTDLTDASGAVDIISLLRIGSVVYVTLGSDYTEQVAVGETPPAASSIYLDSYDYLVTNSATGSDDDTITLAQFNAGSFSSGDTIAFATDEIFEGTITVPSSGSSGSPIVIGAFGTGAKPVILGGEEVSGWDLHDGNIYRTYYNGTVDQLLCDNERMQMSREPDVGWYDVTTSTSSTVFASTDLPSSTDDYYNGTSVIGRTTRYYLLSATVSDYTGSTNTITIDGFFGTTYLDLEEGFYMLNKYEFIDQAYEWYYDSTKDSIYFWSPDGTDPDNFTVYVSNVDNNVYMSDKNYVNIENLSLVGASEDAVFIQDNSTGSTYIEVNNCNILYPSFHGINSYDLDDLGDNNDNLTFYGNYIDGAGLQGIWYEGDNIITRKDTILRSGWRNNNVLEQYGYGNGINTRYSATTIDSCYVRWAAYCGIKFGGQYDSIYYNYVDSVCMVLDDGGGIYTYSGSGDPNRVIGSVVKYNIVSNSIGDENGVPPTSTRYFPAAFGIYMDDYSKDVDVMNNYVINTSHAGYYSHYNDACYFEYNFAIDCGIGFVISNSVGASTFMYDTVYINDDTYSTSWWTDGSAKIWKLDNQGAGQTIDYNYYYDHYNTDNEFHTSTYRSWTEWLADTSYDDNTSFENTQFTTETDTVVVNSSLTEELIFNESGTWEDIEGNTITTPFAVAPFTAIILIKQ